MHLNLRSAWAGIRTMRWPHPPSGRRWKVWRIGWRWKAAWLHLWTPVWHEGRGPYVSMGLWFFAVGRGY